MTEPKSDQSAIVARREQVKSFQRPERLSDLDIKQSVSEVRETADLWRVWVPEWLIVFTSTKPGDAGEVEAKEFFLAKYHERVRDEDVRYTPISQKRAYGTRLELRLPNIKAEFKHKADAEAYAASQFPGATIVARNSRDEYALREYGNKKLARSKS